MKNFIQQIYTNLNLENEGNIFNKIDNISNHLNLKTYYIPFSSEINNLDGNWRIFLNENQSKLRIWEDFGVLLGIYFQSIEKLDKIKLETPVEVIREISPFAYNFCIPDFMLKKLTFSADEQQTIKLIARTFTVGERFAAKRLSLYRCDLKHSTM